MVRTIKGRVWKLGHSINTDLITPTKYMSLPLDEMKEHALEPIMPQFAGEVKPGDVIVAGKNFGCGSSRETAVTVLKALRIGAVVAESFARIFFRNAIAQGLPILTLPGAPEHFDQGEEIQVDMEKATVKNLGRDVQFQGEPMSQDMLVILRKGGILALLKEKMGSTA